MSVRVNFGKAKFLQIGIKTNFKIRNDIIESLKNEVVSLLVWLFIRIIF